MRGSFEAGGFLPPDVEYRVVDNTTRNAMDAYQAYDYFRDTTAARYLLLVHQDLVLNKATCSDLLEKLSELDSLDPSWAMAGNAGKQDDWLKGPICLEDQAGLHFDRSYTYPANVFSLDENFLIFNLRNNFQRQDVGTGFHFYGTILTLSAQVAGLRSYVIDFPLKHLSKGTIDATFFDAKQNIERKGSFRFVKDTQPTTCTVLCFSSVKRVQRIAFARSLLMLLHDPETHGKGLEELWARRERNWVLLFPALGCACLEMCFTHTRMLSCRELWRVVQVCRGARLSGSIRTKIRSLSNIVSQQPLAQRLISRTTMRILLGERLTHTVMTKSRRR